MTTPTPKEIRTMPMSKLFQWIKSQVSQSDTYTRHMEWTGRIDDAVWLEDRAREGVLKGYGISMVLHGNGGCSAWWLGEGMSDAGTTLTNSELESRLRALALALVAAGKR